MSKEPLKPAKISAKDKLFEAAFSLIRQKGYSATTVDELCTFAGVTKGSFFHYFVSKEDLAVQSADHWSFVTGKFFESAPYQNLSDPLDRLLGYIDFRREILLGKIPEFTCLVGTMLQEVYTEHPKIKKACQESIFEHADHIEKEIREALKLYKPLKKITAKSLALHTQAVIQGGFILAKASGSSALAAESLDHLKNYIQLLFNQQIRKAI
jgi:TetR/AcrR family transcriptional regulator, transcriptional repressor for nem operon